MNWDEYRRDDDSIDLAKAARHINVGVLNRRSVEYLRQIENLQSITSRQATAIAIVNALKIVEPKE